MKRRRWALLCAVAAACSREPVIVERPVVIYAPEACPVSPSQAFGVLYAAGDFQPTSDDPPIAKLFFRDVGTVLAGLPERARSIAVDVSEGDRRWSGFTESIPESGPVNVLVWPRGEACWLTRNVEEREDTTIGVFGRHVMIVGGKTADGPVPHTFVGDLSTGAMEALDLGLLVRRSRPTVTPFRARDDELPSAALVAGGEDPNGDAIDTAEVYVPKPGARGDLGDFDRAATVRLSDGRAGHGAIVLASGATLLVGGVGRNRTPLRSMEMIDPTSRQSRSDGLQQLAFARKNPTVLRLANGDVMVAGGTDAADEPVAAIEWFSADVKAKRRRSIDLVTGRERGIVPLPAGGALAVVAPEDPTATGFKTVYVISSEGGVEPGIPIDPAELLHVRLFEGAGGAPVLWTGRRWMRWQPWFAAFSPMPDAPAQGPAVGSFANGDNGLAVWLDRRDSAGLSVAGWRFDARPRFDAIVGPLLVVGPELLVPDRIPAKGGSIDLDPARGLQLGPGASVFVPDLSFADVRVELEVVGAAPEIVLQTDRGAELSVGGAACAFAQAAQRSLVVERAGKDVRVRLDDRDARPCPIELDPSARVSLGLRGASGTDASGARNLRVTRL